MRQFTPMRDLPSQKPPCTVSDASRPPGRPKTGQSDLSKRVSLGEDAVELCQLPHMSMAMVPDVYEPPTTSNSQTRLDYSPSNPVLLLNNISTADFDLSQGPDTNDLPMTDPNTITVDAMEAAFPNETMIIDESWDHPQFFDGFDWQLPTLVSLQYQSSAPPVLISDLGCGGLVR